MADAFDSRWRVLECWRMSDRSTGPWDEVVIADARGATARLALTRSRRGLWIWIWQETWLGHATRLGGTTAYRARADCLSSLLNALENLGFPELAEAILQWERN